jgi:hypothetical protein
MYDDSRSPVCDNSGDSLHEILTMMKLKEEMDERKRPDAETE